MDPVFLRLHATHSQLAAYAERLIRSCNTIEDRKAAPVESEEYEEKTLQKMALRNVLNKKVSRTSEVVQFLRVVLNGHRENHTLFQERLRPKHEYPTRAADAKRCLNRNVPMIPAD